MINLLEKYNRVFFIEPNLIKGLGHVVEYPMSINKYIGSQSGVYYLGNKRIQSNVRENFPIVQGVITQTCFEGLETKGKVFQEDLIKLDKTYSFKPNDLIVVLTSYWNEVRGLNNWLGKNSNGPQAVCWIHQIFPPATEFKQTLESRFVRKIEKQWQISTSNLSENITLAVPPVDKLQKEMERLTTKHVIKIPFPYEYREHHMNKTSVRCRRIAFLGDGRYEKGLIYLLQDISERKDIDYYIQNLNPRGYDNTERLYFENMLNKIILQSNVTVYSKPLFPHKFISMLSRFDLIVLPYLPESYDKRGSGIYVQAAQHSIPVIAPDKTWISEEVNRFGNGLTYKYAPNKGISYNSNIVSNTIGKAIIEYMQISKSAERAQDYYLNEYSAESFLNKLSLI